MENNYAFIDGQNLYLGTQAENFDLDLARFRIYLKEKYKVSVAYYFLGCIFDANTELYDEIQKAGFVLKFREHNSNMIGNKKGNVDTDVVFEMMRSLINENQMSKIVLVSGDGDYKKVVDYLIKKDKFLKILFPNNRYSSLYKEITVKYFDKLCDEHVRSKIEQKKKRT
ncbi:MAG: NYN domain-containing protein [Candidatus Nomurabacteria bacterium]|nr:NYN domain-containing protein [Candidatus Nomurabacteria bacterium]